MTGYGVASAQFGDGELIAEIRALNHRYLDVRTTVTADLTSYAHEAEQTLRKQVARGRYELRLRSTGAVPTALELDVDAARQIYRALVALKSQLGDSAPVSLEAALGVLPEPLRAPRAAEEISAQIQTVVCAALENLDAMRSREGATLNAELRAALSAIRAHRDDAAKGCASAVESQRARFRDRVKVLLEGTHAEIDGARLETEIAVLAERSDVTEELVRLDSHASQVESLLSGAADDAVGRKLDFLLQELNREANTLAAKCQDAAVTHIAVEIKAEIERMRQQAANVL